MTMRGGASSDGTVFRMTPAGALTTLLSFNNSNGGYPYGGLIKAADGSFYGTTNLGGTGGCGTIFNVTPAGALMTLASFDCVTNGANPTGGLVQDAAGNLYGTAFDNSLSIPTVFKLASDSSLTTLATIDSPGPNYLSGLVQGADGNFYGTTATGGKKKHGSVFKVTPAGALTTLASFNGSNGGQPLAPLILGTVGNFYGTTSQLGPQDGDVGTVFRMTPAGVLTTLAVFDDNPGDSPAAAVMQGADGYLYGTTRYNGPFYGTGFTGGPVFKLKLP
jgi:uncharacterized repeat protein (TIGR03803 family)